VREPGYSPGFLALPSCGVASSPLEDAPAASLRPRNCDFRRFRFSRNASFSRSRLGPFPGSRSRLSLSSCIVVPLKYDGLLEHITGRADRRANPCAGAARKFADNIREWPLVRELGTGSARNRAPSRSWRPHGANFAGFRSRPRQPAALAPAWALWQGSAALSGPFWLIPVDPRARCRSSVVEHSIGNGEVDSSILSGSTSHLWRGSRYSRPIGPIAVTRVTYPPNLTQ
jgi:hypothetical protein